MKLITTCDDVIDEDVQITFYADSDADGFGDEVNTTQACIAPNGFVDDSTDCDDSDANSNPVASEVCDEVDNDCDGGVDEDVQLTFYADTDGDGFGVPDSTTLACVAPEGFSDVDTDCNESYILFSRQEGSV